jgi:hypothetical protein
MKGTAVAVATAAMLVLAMPGATVAYISSATVTGGPTPNPVYQGGAVSYNVHVINIADDIPDIFVSHSFSVIGVSGVAGISVAYSPCVEISAWWPGDLYGVVLQTNSFTPIGTYNLQLVVKEWSSVSDCTGSQWDLAPASTTITVAPPLTQTITFNTLSDRTYGAAAFTLTASASSGLPVSYGTTGPCSASGTTLSITGVGTCSVTASQAGGGGWAAATPVTRSFAINRALLTVTADNQSRLVGQANPTFTYHTTGFVYGQTAAVLSGAPDISTTADTSSPVGPYPITPTLGTLSAANYSFSFVNATLTVAQGAQTITFNALPDRTYGVAPFALTATASSGLTVTYGTAGPCTESGSTLTITGVGTCSVTAYQLGDVTYPAAAPITRTFTVNPAPLTITAQNATKIQGDPNPALSALISGFVLSETPAVLTSSPSCDTTATTSSPVGPYPITCSGAAADNYAIGYVDATLTVTAGGLHHIATSPDPAFITAGGTQAYTATALDANGNSLGDVTGSTTFTIDGAACAGNICGSTVVASHTVTGSYSGLTDTAALNVLPSSADHVLISPDGATIAAGGSRAYTAEAFDSNGNSVGDVTGAMTFSIDTGSCTGNVCRSTAVGDRTVTGALDLAALGRFTDTAALHVTAANGTLPPTSSLGESASGGGSLPFPSLLVALVMGCLGLLVVDRRRRSVRL